MSDLAKGLIIARAFLIFAGIVTALAGKIPGIGRLPGDILIKKENFTFYFPLMTSILLSILLSVIFYFINRR